MVARDSWATSKAISAILSMVVMTGVTVGSVLVDGSISACASIRSNYHQAISTRMISWISGSTVSLPYRNREWMRKGECAECRYFRYCQGSGMHLRDDEAISSCARFIDYMSCSESPIVSNSYSPKSFLGNMAIFSCSLLILSL